MDEPITSLTNQYLGINPHLNSHLQTPGSEEEGLSLWPSFHSSHVAHIADFLNELLPPTYTARAEQSLQVRTYDLEAEFRTRKPEPDVTIYGQQVGTTAVGVTATPGTSTFPLNDTIDLAEDFIKAVVVRDTREDARLGKVVVRIELLSPSNKPGRIGYELYRKGRNDALYSHVPLIELDYLHETPPPVMKYPVYPSYPGAQAYNIFVSDPRPTISTGQFVPYDFDVDKPFPVVIIPLAGDETLPFDFGTVYQHTYKRGRWGIWRNLVDYAQFPPRFHTYSPADQERIQRRMAAITDAHQRGLDLEQGPFPLLQ